MLAYVFWHWQKVDVNVASYRNLLEVFHQTLSANKPEGFLSSTVFSLPHAPWHGVGSTAHEDWYLLDNSAALDTLNLAAVSGACEKPHNLVARDAADGTAGLYRLLSGHDDLGAARWAVWFSKPAGVSYSKLESILKPIVSPPGTGLWQRQMTLGPTTEFAVYSPTEVRLPAGIEGTSLPLELIWPTSRPVGYQIT